MYSCQSILQHDLKWMFRQGIYNHWFGCIFSEYFLDLWNGVMADELMFWAKRRNGENENHIVPTVILTSTCIHIEERGMQDIN